MTAPDSVRVFVDARAVDVPRGSTAIDAVRAHDSALASAVDAGTRLITDSRGLPTPADTPVHAGAIFRVIAKRDRGSRAPASE